MLFYFMLFYFHLFLIDVIVFYCMFDFIVI